MPDALKTPSPKAPNGSCRRLGHDGDHATSQDRLRRASWPEEDKKGDDKEGGPPMKRKGAT